MNNDGFVFGGDLCCDGAINAVNWTDIAILQNAIFTNFPVKLGVAGNQLKTIPQQERGWFAVNLAVDTAYNHCVGLCGFGTLAGSLHNLEFRFRRA